LPVNRRVESSNPSLTKEKTGQTDWSVLFFVKERLKGA
jgi:hypothetical protein